MEANYLFSGEIYARFAVRGDDPPFFEAVTPKVRGTCQVPRTCMNYSLLGCCCFGKIIEPFRLADCRLGGLSP